MVPVADPWINNQLAAAKHFIRKIVSSDQAILVMLAHLGNVKQKKRESLKSFLTHFITELPRVRCAPDARVLAYLTNRVLPKTPF